MRIYLPATSTDLRQLLTSGGFDSVPLTAFAVTPGLREWYVDGDDEALEYAAASEAARASLRLIDADASAARRRVVIAADVPESDVTVADEIDRGVVRVDRAIGMEQIASLHVDDRDAVSTIAAASAAIIAADLGDPSAQNVVDDAEGFELAWYATQELPSLLIDL